MRVQDTRIWKIGLFSPFHTASLYWPVTTWINICLVTTAQVFLHDYSSTWCQNVIRSLAVFLARRQISCCCCLIEKKFGRKFSYSVIEFLRLSVCPREITLDQHFIWFASIDNSIKSEFLFNWQSWKMRSLCAILSSRQFKTKMQMMRNWGWWSIFKCTPLTKRRD